jgi:hypothetical protein
MASDQNDSVEDFQRKTREMLRAQQEAYLEAVKAWRQATPPGIEPVPWPKMS